MTNNLPSTDASVEIRTFFDKFYQNQVSFPSNQIDAVLGYFLKRGFDEESARSTSIVLLNQSRIDNVNVFQLLDTLKGLTDSQLSSIVTEILNAYRANTSSLGYAVTTIEETSENRNIRQ